MDNNFKIKNKNLEFTVALVLEIIEFSIMICFMVFKLKFKLISIFITLLVFGIVRISIKKTGKRNDHFKITSYFDNGWKRCIFYTYLFLISMCAITDNNINVGILATAFGTLVTSEIADILELTYGIRNLDIDYKIVYSWVRMNQNDSRIISFEENLKRDSFNYTIYRNVFLGYSTKEDTALDLGFSQSNYLDRHITRIIGRLEETIPEIKDLNK